MRGNIIEELYYGNVDPQDHGYHPKSPVKKASDSLNDLEEMLGILVGQRVTAKLYQGICKGWYRR